MESVTLTLVGKAGCHLCDVAKETIQVVLADVQRMSRAPRIVLEEQSIADNPVLREQYWDKIPVLLIDGMVHSVWHVDPDRLKQHIIHGR